MSAVDCGGGCSPFAITAAAWCLRAGFCCFCFPFPSSPPESAVVADPSPSRSTLLVILPAARVAYTPGLAVEGERGATVRTRLSTPCDLIHTHSTATQYTADKSTAISQHPPSESREGGRAREIGFASCCCRLRSLDCHSFCPIASTSQLPHPLLFLFDLLSQHMVPTITYTHFTFIFIPGYLPGHTYGTHSLH